MCILINSWEVSTLTSSCVVKENVQLSFQQCDYDYTHTGRYSALQVCRKPVTAGRNNSNM